MPAITELRKAEIRALLREREECLRRGAIERVEQIDEELGEKARTATLPHQRAQKRPAVPSRRTSR